MTVSRTDVEQVERANTAFYEAMERGDFDELSALWLSTSDVKDMTETKDTYETETTYEIDTADGTDTEDAPSPARVSCVHPGWPVLTGRGEVLRSYALIMANTDYIQFFLTDVHVSVSGDTALVTCTENILSGGPAPEDAPGPGPLLGQLVVATNVFHRTSEGWKLWSHHASPVLAETGEDEDDETPA